MAARRKRHGVALGSLVALVALVCLMLGSTTADAGKSPGKASSGPYFAPYIDMAAYPRPDLVAVRQNSGHVVKTISLGFITADQGKNADGKAKCKPTWGGYSDYQASGRKPDRLKNIDAFRHDGGQIVLSFGGAAGTELASACKSVKSLTAAYRSAIKAYGATRLDFDVEGKTINDSAATKRRSEALRKLQTGKTKISFTLPVTPHGLDSKGKAVIKSLKREHVKLNVANAMAMDYGDDGAEMGDRAVGVGDALHSQLQSLLHIGSSAAWSKVGLTPMIGVNDYSSEVFTLADASQLYAYAHQHKIGMLGMWQLARDHDCNQNPQPTETREDCSGVYQGDYAFSYKLSSDTNP